MLNSLVSASSTPQSSLWVTRGLRNINCFSIRGGTTKYIVEVGIDDY